MSELKEFVVEYSPNWCHIEETSVKPCHTLDQYKEAYARHKICFPEAPFGSFCYWNNAAWVIVKARNAKDAWDKCKLASIAYDQVRRGNKEVQND